MNQNTGDQVPQNAAAIDVSGARIASQSFGHPHHPTLLLIMGATASRDWWDERFCQELAQRNFFVVRYDHRDTGESTACPPGQRNYDLGNLVDDAVAILDHYGRPSAILFGMSLGGMIAQLVAIRFPHRVDALVLLSSSAWEENPDLPSIGEKVLAYHAVAGTLDWQDESAVLDYLAGSWEVLAGSRFPFERERIESLARAEQRRAVSLLSRFNHTTLTGCEEDYGRSSEIAAPTLVIHGDEDPVLPWPHAERLAQVIPNARLVRLSGVGHELPRPVWPLVIQSVEELVRSSR